MGYLRNFGFALWSPQGLINSVNGLCACARATSSETCLRSLNPANEKSSPRDGTWGISAEEKSGFCLVGGVDGVGCRDTPLVSAPNTLPPSTDLCTKLVCRDFMAGSSSLSTHPHSVSACLGFPGIFVVEPCKRGILANGFDPCKITKVPVFPCRPLCVFFPCRDFSEFPQITIYAFCGVSHRHGGYVSVFPRWCCCHTQSPLPCLLCFPGIRLDVYRLLPWHLTPVSFHRCFLDTGHIFSTPVGIPI